MKKWYESKTLWIAVMQGVIGVVVVLETQYPSIGAVAVAKSILDIALRTITFESLEK